MNRTCKQCGNDISHKATQARFCDNVCKDRWNNANRPKSPSSALVVPTSDTPPMPQNIGEAILEAIQETNRLLGLLVAGGGSVTVKERVVEREVTFSQNRTGALQEGPIENITGIELEVKRATLTGDAALIPSHNMSISMVGIGAAKIEELSTECLIYAIESRKLPMDICQGVLDRRAAKQNAKVAGNAKPLAGAHIEFAAPAEFEDLELL